MNNIKTSFLKNVVLLTGLTGISQLIPFLTLPLLQKYFYSPENFGLLSVYASFSLMFVKFSTFSYEFAIIKKENKNEALSVLKGASQILIANTFFIALILFVLFCFFKSNFYVKTLGSFIFFVPFTMLFFGGYQILRYWFNWGKKYSTIGSSMIIKSMTAESSKILQGLIGLTNYGLIVGRNVGEFFSFIFLFIPFISNDYNTLKKIKQKEVFKELKKNYKFPLYTMPSGIKGTLINVIFITLFVKYFGINKGGIIGISLSYTGAAFGIISQSFSQVFYKKINELKNTELLKNLKKNTLLLSVFSLFSILIVQAIPNQIVITLIGKNWIDLLPVIKVLIFSTCFSFISSSLSFTYIRVNRQKEMLFFDVFHILLIYFSILIGYNFTNDFMGTLTYYVIAQSIFYSFTIFLSFYFVQKLS